MFDDILGNPNARRAIAVLQQEWHRSAFPIHSGLQNVLDTAETQALKLS